MVSLKFLSCLTYLLDYRQAHACVPTDLLDLKLISNMQHHFIFMVSSNSNADVLKFDPIVL